MIEVLFHFAGDSIFARIDGTNVFFGNTSQGPYLAPIQNLKLSLEGTLKEFPELKGDPRWNEKAIMLFKERIKSLKTERERAEYIINDLRRHGYQPKYLQEKGHRVERIS